MRKLFTLSILLIALAAGFYTQRVEVMDWYRSVTASELPESVAYDEVSAGVIPTSDSKVESPHLEIPRRAELDQVAELLLDDKVGDPSSTTDDLGVHQNDNDTVEGEEPAVEEFVEEVTIDEPAKEEDVLPASINLAVPFTSQAPHGNWDEPYKEACEEASVYMVQAYFSGVDAGQIPADEADEDLQKMIAFEMEVFGFYKDTTAEQTGMFAELMYGATYKVIIDPSVEDIKRILAQGNPVIVPAAGRLLGNPYFTPPGPLYHMLVIRGYTQNGQFIVNDPGTYRGEAYLYDFDTIMNAMHDWNDGEEITEGKKVVLVLSP